MSAVMYTDLTNDPKTVLRVQYVHVPPITNVAGTKRALACAEAPNAIVP